MVFRPRIVLLPHSSKQGDHALARPFVHRMLHLDDRVIELTEADRNWLGLNAIAWSAVAG